MTLLHRWRRLTFQQKKLRVLAFLTVASIRVSLTVLPFRFTRRLVARLSVSGLAKPTSDVHEVCHAVMLAARFIPRATCLTQAFAGSILCIRRGLPTELRIGVLRQQDGPLKAHAWLEADGHVVLGSNAELDTFLPLPFDLHSAATSRLSLQ